MKARYVYIVVGIIGFGLVSGLVGAVRAAGAPPWLNIALAGLQILVFMALLLGISAQRRRRERAERTMEPDSVERQAAVLAQSKVFVDILLLTLVVGCLFIIFPTETNPGWVLIGLVVVTVADFWVRYAVITRAGPRVEL